MRVFFSLVVITLCNATPFTTFKKNINRRVPAVYQEVAKYEDGNILVSPFSLETLLALTLWGAKDATAQQLSKRLRLATKNIDEEFETLLALLSETSMYRLNLANKVYVDKRFEPRSDFVESASSFNGEVETIDFSSNPDQMVTSWARNKTNHAIVDLIDPDWFKQGTVFLFNAACFQGQFSDRLFTNSSEKKTFTPIDSSEEVQVDVVSNRKGKYFLHHKSKMLKAQILKLPFKGEEAALTIVLPYDRDDLAHLERHLHHVVKTHSYEYRKLDVILPVFQIATKIAFKKILKLFGIRHIFDPKTVDLTGIGGDKGDLVVAEVVQQVYFDFGKDGVQTKHDSYESGETPVDDAKEEKFHALHPFMFYVKIKGEVMFIGRVTDPSV